MSGMSPIGLNPPSVLGRSTTTTTPTPSGHIPKYSHRSSRPTHKARSSSSNLIKALGWTASQPSPVPAGKEKRASRKRWTDRSFSLSVCSGHSKISCAMSDAHCLHQSFRSEFARRCDPSGVSWSAIGGVALISSYSDNPSTASVSSRVEPSCWPILLSIHPEAFLDRRCWRFSPLGGPLLDPVLELHGCQSDCFCFRGS